MLKQLTVFSAAVILGFNALAATIDPAMAEKGKVRWVEPSPHYTYDVVPKKRGVVVYKSKQKKQKFEDTLDLETEAVWRSLRPTRFID